MANVAEYWLTGNGYMKHHSEERFMHRDVWIEANGPIPRGFHIHHKNGIKTDNRLENLECRSPSDHMARHGLTLKQSNSWAKRVRKMAIRSFECWSCGKEAQSWHPLAFCCKECGQKYNNWLHDLKKAVEREARKVQRACVICGVVFKPHDNHQKCCSWKCTTTTARKNWNAKLRLRTAMRAAHAN